MQQSSQVSTIDNLPNHWQLLSTSDLEAYYSLRKTINSEIGKSRKGERLESFLMKIKQIRNFIERMDQNDWKRSLVCGIVFLSNSIAINIQQLRLLFGKCKSSINGSFQQLGYSALPPGRELSAEFLCRIPLFQHNTSELKKWTIRENISQKMVQKQKIFIVPIPQIPKQYLQPTMTPNNVKKLVETNFPCPVKFRHKFENQISIPT